MPQKYKTLSTHGKSFYGTLLLATVMRPRITVSPSSKSVPILFIAYTYTVQGYFVLISLPLSSVIPAMVTGRVSPSGPVIEGSTVDLVCEATAGDLPISYSWTGPSGQDVSLADTDGTISVTISASGDYGTYTCAATNEFGMGNASVEVIQAGI